jgi:orotate phosphoribosyltransferase
VGSQVAMHLDCEFAVTLGKGEEILFHRRYSPNIDQPVCFVEDIIFSGTDVEANIKFLKQIGFKDIYICCWMNRREEIINGVKVYSLIENIFEKYETQSCPLCQNQEEIMYDGVRE